MVHNSKHKKRKNKHHRNQRENVYIQETPILTKSGLKTRGTNYI